MRGSIVWTAVSLAACGGAPEVKGPDACAEGKRLLGAKVGPELDSVLVAQPTPTSAETEQAGCALVYVQIGEEMPEELPEGDLPEGGPSDQRLAFALFGPNGKLQITLVSPLPDAAGSVLLTLAARDVTGDGRPEVIVQEDGSGASQYRGLRVFATSPGEPKPRDLLSQRLLVKTPEGLDLVPTWRSGELDGKRGIFFEGAGTWKIFTWNDNAKVFAFDEKATAAKNPKPAPAPAATPDATATPEGAATPAAPAAKPTDPPAGMPDLNLP